MAVRVSDVVLLSTSTPQLSMCLMLSTCCLLDSGLLTHVNVDVLKQDRVGVGPASSFACRYLDLMEGRDSVRGGGGGTNQVHVDRDCHRGLSHSSNSAALEEVTE